MGKLAEIKTKQTESSVADFINGLENEQKRNDSLVLLNMFQKASKEDPKLWSNSTIGFGSVRLKSPTTGREVDWYNIGFSPRKTNLTLYLCGNVKVHEKALTKLGKHKTGGGCLYINKLSEIDLKVLEQIVDSAMERGWQL